MSCYEGITEELEWYFSKGLTNITIIKEKNLIRIEHEDGIYYVDLPVDNQLVEFLKDFIQEG